jgi:STE24 endopeptidase
MASFDPAAATAAYLAQLPQQAQAKAVAYTQGSHWLLLWGWLVALAACWLILKSRILARVEAGLEHEKPRPIVASFLVSLIFLGLDAVLELPWAAYAQWWREGLYGLTSQPFVSWLTDNLIQAGVQTLFVALFLVALYALMRAARASWPLWAGALAGGFMLFSTWAQPVFIEPLINHYTPAPPGPVLDLVTAMAKANGVPTDRIYVYNGSKQSNRYTANVSGIGGSARVALSDTMFSKGADLAEIKGVVGHEMGHYVRQHALWDTGILALLAVIASWLLQRLFPVVRGLLRASEVGGVADPAGLPILAGVFATLVLLGTPLLNTVSRLQEADADAFSLSDANEPDGLAKALIKTAEYRAPSPPEWEEVIFYDHPSIGRRVRAAMDWKAAHMSLSRREREGPGASAPGG